LSFVNLDKEAKFSTRTDNRVDADNGSHRVPQADKFSGIPFPAKGA
jgi:hypothetical protein